MNKRLFISAVCAALACTSKAAMATQVGGISFEETIDIKGSKLVLNGAGVRYKAVFKVYAAALYVGKKSTNPSDLLSQAGNKRIAMTMLRDVDAGELGRLFTRGIEDNTARAEASRILPDVLRMSQVFSDYKNLKAGDAITMDWVTGTGTVISIKGKVYGEPFKDPEFFRTLLNIWLGKSPADWKLKESLLGL